MKLPTPAGGDPMPAQLLGKSAEMPRSGGVPWAGSVVHVRSGSEGRPRRVLGRGRDVEHVGALRDGRPRVEVRRERARARELKRDGDVGVVPQLSPERLEQGLLGIAGLDVDDVPGQAAASRHRHCGVGRRGRHAVRTCGVASAATTFDGAARIGLHHRAGVDQRRRSGGVVVAGACVDRRGDERDADGGPVGTEPSRVARAIGERRRRALHGSGSSRTAQANATAFCAGRPRNEDDTKRSSAPRSGRVCGAAIAARFPGRA